MVEILYQDAQVIVCCKPAGVLSQGDDADAMPALLLHRKHIAKPFLETILGIKILDLQEPESEKSTETSPFNKGARGNIVFVAPDRGDRYFNKGLYE